MARLYVHGVGDVLEHWEDWHGEELMQAICDVWMSKKRVLARFFCFGMIGKSNYRDSMIDDFARVLVP